MKKRFTFIAALITTFAIYSVSGQTPVTTQAQWPEKNEFHKVMAQTFHPSEEGNFEPIRSRIGEMHEKAVAWMNSTPPKEYDKPEIKSTMKEMLGQIVELKAMIDKKATNEELKPKLEALHETFHKIVGMCSKDESHEGHSHDQKSPGEHKE
jgi:hypothetical protein